MVNFDIDLGTTNSLIAKFDKGPVEVFKNPNGFKETLPSVIGFRNDRILIGDEIRIVAGADLPRAGDVHEDGLSFGPEVVKDGVTLDDAGVEVYIIGGQPDLVVVGANVGRDFLGP